MARVDGQRARRCRLLPTYLAKPITDPGEIKKRLVEQVTGTVRWRECVATMAANGVTDFYEIGAGKVLAGLVKRIGNDGQCGEPRHTGRHRRGARRTSAT